MRNPFLALEHMQGWKEVGERIWTAVSPILEVCKEARAVGEKFGTIGYTGPGYEVIQRVRAALADEFSIKELHNKQRYIGKPSPIDRGLFTGLLRAAGDWEC